MKILFIGKDDCGDYQAGILFHGLKALFGKDVYETAPLDALFDDYPQEKRKNLYGKGFTLFCQIPASFRNAPPHVEVRRMVRERFFDFVVYGSIWRSDFLFGLVSRHYPKERILAIDGEDKTNLRRFFVGKTLYFKRECLQEEEGVFPISFGIPKHKILESVPPKTRRMALIVPGKPETYVYEDEASYYQGYAESWFGTTTKKAGWDCMRHYEIMANGCIPYFPGLEHCPARTMTLFPKNLALKANKLYEEGEQASEKLLRCCGQFLEHTRQFLTTEAIAAWALEMAERQKERPRSAFSKISSRIQWLVYKPVNRVFRLFVPVRATH
jgi:hypothetical protein